MDRNELRKIPGVDRLLEIPEAAAYAAEISAPVAADVIRRTLDVVRAEVAQTGHCPPFDEIAGRALDALHEMKMMFFHDVINATGVIIHTNLGRAPLGRETIEKTGSAGGGYSNLEYSVSRGGRGFRGDLQERLIAALTGAEDATVVNNNAGAMFLALAQYAKGREAIVSRGELVQIGGGFRVPEILAQSGAAMREVGTTNQTLIDDFRRAANENTGIILKVHHSNFLMQGFVAGPSDKELSALSRELGVPFLYDIGSGAVYDTVKYGLAHEPTVQDALRGGADLVCFSGDKLLGGPQAGIIAGKKQWVAPLKKHPLFRALRPDKLCLSALEQTLIHHLNGEAERKIPVVRMMASKPEELRSRAERIASELNAGAGSAGVIPGESAIGGGSLPGRTLPTFLVAVRPAGSPDRLAELLRIGNPHVIARIADGAVLLDPRTVPEERDGDLARAINAAMAT